MNEEKKTEEKTTPEGAVEVEEEDLDKASGGAAYLKMPVEPDYDLKPTINPDLKDPSLTSPDPTLSGYDLKKI